MPLWYCKGVEKSLWAGTSVSAPLPVPNAKGIFWTIYGKGNGTGTGKGVAEGLYTLAILCFPGPKLAMGSGAYIKAPRVL